MFFIYCDESCHLENDYKDYMILGAIRTFSDKRRQIAKDIGDIKVKHGLSKWTEIKWTKVSKSKLDFYKELIDYFFENDYIHFRAVIADKIGLDHERYEQDHDDWYYKMYYVLLNKFIVNRAPNTILIDIKDTNGAYKVNYLKETLRNKFYDDRGNVIKNIQLVRSEESQLVQLSDLIIGAVGYANRQLQTSPAKLELVNYISRTFNLNLLKTNNNSKLNLFKWEPDYYQGQDILWKQNM